MPVAPDATLPAALAATYVVGDVLGRGATSTVYVAMAADGRQGALKVISQPNAALIELEAQALRDGRLGHPNLARVFATGCVASPAPMGFTFMEHLRGPVLCDLLAPGPLPWREAAALAIDIAHGLAAMHAQGFIHRDVKPNNICETDRGAVLLDFGSLARVGQPVAAPGTGTPAYMAPEQVFAAQLTPAADIYALGCVLFEMLCGSTPYTGSGLHLLVNHAHASFPAHRLVGIAPREVIDIIVACCAKAPAHRPDAHAVAAQLERCLQRSAPLASTRRKRTSIAASGVAAAGLAALLALFLFAPTTSSAADVGVSDAWYSSLVATTAPPRTAMVSGDHVQLVMTASGNHIDLQIADDAGNPIALREIVVRIAREDAAALVFNARAVAPGHWQLTTAVAMLDMRVGIYLPDRDALIEALL